MLPDRVKKTNNIRLACLLTTVFAVMFVLTQITPLVADDYNYAFSWSYWIRIDNMTLLRQSMEVHRRYTNGRVFAHGWVTMLLMYPRWVFSLANALILTAFVYTSYRFFCCKGIRRPLRSSAFLLMLLWVCMPSFGQVFLWLDGACNYFWGVALAWGILYQLFCLDAGVKNRNLRTTLTVPFAFVAGAWSEHISFAMLMAAFLLSVKKWIREKHFPLRETLILLSGCGGYLYLMLAPSMVPARLKTTAQTVTEGRVTRTIDFLEGHIWIPVIILAVLCGLVLLLRRPSSRRGRLLVLCAALSGVFGILAVVTGFRAAMKAGFDGLVSSAALGFFLLLSVTMFLVYMQMKKRKDEETLHEAIILCFSGFCSLLLFVLTAPYLPGRGFCAAVVFTSIAAALVFGKLDPPPKALHIMAGAVFLIFFAAGSIDILRVHQADLERQEAIRQALETDGVLTTSPFPSRTKYSAQYGLQDLEPGARWPNDYMKEYYGLSEIVVEIP